MVIISDCLTEKIDEGCLKVANSLSKRLQEQAAATIISFNRKPNYSDVHLKLNKLFLNLSLWRIIRKYSEEVLYIPFASNTLASAARTFVLSLFSPKRTSVLFVMRFPMSKMTKLLLKLSRARIVALSKESYDFYIEQIGQQVIYLKTGIDTSRFHPVCEEEKEQLKKKYGIPLDEQVVLHVGHLKAGRNVDKLAGIDKQYHVITVVSSVTEAEKDASIRTLLKSRASTTLIEDYIPNIEEIYQMADVYVFPVEKPLNCIDVPLSVLEAAACNVPVVTTRYGELKNFEGKDGFLFVDTVSEMSLNSAIKEVIKTKKYDVRGAVMDYDWAYSIEKLTALE
ncbi:glycosyltransferase [Negativibacillus massiliensis]|uniref:glycosyltransferase n=1 Tax=Negativibacillus massiliensis TaxID=1871035 RepID=UPI003AF2123F